MKATIFFKKNERNKDKEIFENVLFFSCFDNAFVNVEFLDPKAHENKVLSFDLQSLEWFDLRDFAPMTLELILKNEDNELIKEIFENVVSCSFCGSTFIGFSYFEKDHPEKEIRAHFVKDGVLSYVLKDTKTMKGA